MNKHILVAVAWPYVNGDLHVGHLAGYLLPADMFARFHRQIGNTVLMVSGSDCFGTPITLEADKRGLTPQEIVEEYHAKNVALFAQYGFSYDLYTKTATDNHRQVTQEMFLKLLANGYIFKDKSQQYYSTQEQKFLPDRYVEGTCPVCGFDQARSDQCDKCGTVLDQGELINPHSKQTGSEVILKETEHYFLDWPKLQPTLEAYVATQTHWKPWVLAETKHWLEKGLKARAITRDLDWGVEIPTDQIPEGQRLKGAENKRIYVWFDAVIGYLSASIEWAGGSEVWKDWWYSDSAEHSYFMGKDNLVFHTLFWPGQLAGAYGAAIHLPDYPSINQFLTLEGQKFSKSRGITIDSKYLADTYGADPIRFYLCSIMPELADASFSWADFVQKHNSLLIGNLGNFINRVLTLGKTVDFGVERPLDPDVVSFVVAKAGEARLALTNHEFKHYLEVLLEISSKGNEYLNQTEPWKHKDQPEVYAAALTTAMVVVICLTILCGPVIPHTQAQLQEMLSLGALGWDEDIESQLHRLLPSVRITNPHPLFTKIDEAVVASEVAKLPHTS